MKTKTDLATTCWEQIKSQLGDRSVLHLEDVDDDVLAELEAEQIRTIALFIHKERAELFDANSHRIS